MKKLTYTLIILMTALTQLSAQTTWDFTTVSNADQSLLNADNSGNWSLDGNSRWCYVGDLNSSPLMANGQELAFGKGLLFSCIANESGNIRLGQNRLWLGGASSPIIIPDLKKGQTISINYKSSSKDAARGITPSNLAGTSGFDASLNEQTGTGTVVADGSVTLAPTGGLYIYSLTVSQASDNQTIVLPGTEIDLYQDVVNNTVARSSKSNQMQVELLNGGINYYNTADLSAVDMDDSHSTVTITPKSGESDVYYGSVRSIQFAKGVSQGDNATIINNGVEITESKGWLESAFVKWAPYEGATSYVVYVKGGQFADWTKLDNMLVRDYGTYGRADMVGLRAATGYAFKVVPVVGEQEDASKASTAEDITVKAYDRQGFAHKTWTNGVGAYNNDGTLKSNAKVLYVTKNTAKTIKCTVITSEKGATTEYTGLQSIIDGYQKGYDSTPLAIRLIGTVNLSDLDHISSKEEGLQIKSNNPENPVNITFEGIGEDATIYGFGILVHGGKSVELRNFAVMKFMVDGLSIDDNNSNVWIHHIDFFYGQPGSAADQKKGDGSIDIKKDSKYVTVDNCHFWDAGKASLCGMKSETGPNYITYHHNWFDHSDSRHARVRTMSVHIYNNYFDGNSKYGAGATTGSSLFVEGNYFRNTNKPMLISMQGTDTKMGADEKNAPTFSGEDGGIIKSFGNVFAEKSSNFKYVTYQQNSTHFDAWEATSRNDQVPSSVTAKKGGSSYNNFDTNSSVMYSYTPDAAADVPALVEGWYGAGRMNHGDFEWTFDNTTDDSDYEVSTELDNAIKAYKTSLVGIFGGETISEGGNPGGEGGEGGDGGETTGTIIDAEVKCNFQNNAPSNNLFTVVGNYSKDKGSATVNGVKYDICLKIESSTSIKFTTTKTMKMTLVFGDNDTKFSIKVNGEKHTGSDHKLEVTLEPNTYELTKADTTNLFYIGLKEQ